MRRRNRFLVILAIALGAIAATGVGWFALGDDPRRLAALGGAPNTCPPWAPIVRYNAFGKGYCSAYDPNEGNAYVGVWASTAYADYFWRNLPCPDWAPRVVNAQGGAGYSIPPDLPTLTCSRYYYGQLITGLLPAGPPPPKPAGAPDPCTGLPCPGLPPRGRY